MAEKEKIILPPRYYLDYFNDLIGFIEKHSGHLLSEGDQNFIKTFRSLTIDAQCLFIRMLNRKGEFFRLDKLQYEEINEYGGALDELSNFEFISLDDINYPEIFTLFTKSELSKVFPEKDLGKMYKDEVIQSLTEEAIEADFQALATHTTLIRLLKQEQVNFLKFLFFGHNYGMMTEFVIRDVGNVKLENLENHEFTPWFDSREEALATYELSNISRAFRKGTEELLPEELKELLLLIDWSNYLQYPRARRSGNKLLIRIGEYFERANLPLEAAEYYQLSERHPARERLIRILEKDGELKKARETALQIIKNPYNATEHLFATDFLNKKSVRNYRSTTVRIKQSQEITVLQDPTINVESLACLYFENLGYQAYHSENYLWRGLFGLIYWEVLFDENHSSFHHPLQRQPSDLFDEAFYEKRASQIEQINKKYKTKKSLLKHVEELYKIKEGIANPMVGWHESLLPTVESAVMLLPLKGLFQVLLKMAQNVKYNSAGFPDLFIWKGKEYQFYEIKSPNDHLSAQQLFWIDFMKAHGIKAEVLRVNYA